MNLKRVWVNITGRPIEVFVLGEFSTPLIYAGRVYDCARLCKTTTLNRKTTFGAPINYLCATEAEAANKKVPPLGWS